MMDKITLKDDDMLLTMETAARYKMTPAEVGAYKLCILWSNLAQEVFPEYNHYRVKTSGDPRKSHLFRICWKLMRETRNMVKDEQYELYIRANLEMLRVMHRATGGVRIDPQILVGDKAWIRWKMWKRKFDKADKAHQVKGVEQIHASTFKIGQELQRTYDFLEKTFGGPPTYDQIFEAKERGDLKHWLGLSKISPYYILLSPFSRKACGGVTGIVAHFDKTDFIVYKGDLNEEVLQIARRTFAYEFESLARRDR